MRLRSWITSSGLGSGARLPPERELSTLLSVSRAELRKALLVLEIEGVLERKVGRGTFITRPVEQHRLAGPVVHITDVAEQTGPLEAMAARLALEPELARMAALHATPRHLRDLRELASAMRASGNWTTYENLDAQFHDLIAEASGNGLLYQLHKVVNGVRLIVVWRRLSQPDTGPSADYHSFDEHDAIIAALTGRAGAEAHAAMQRHLKSTLAAMTANA